MKSKGWRSLSGSAKRVIEAIERGQAPKRLRRHYHDDVARDTAALLAANITLTTTAATVTIVPWKQEGDE